MNPIHGDQLLTPLNWRYATKEFDPARKISPEDGTVLELAAKRLSSGACCAAGYPFGRR